MSEVNKEKREAIKACEALIKEFKEQRDGFVEQIKAEREKITTLRSEIIK
ncbi:MAG: hypothetical protein ACJAS1_003628 [Oleiphilaceae bacterium]|jgi:hypothetical protein